MRPDRALPSRRSGTTAVWLLLGLTVLGLGVRSTGIDPTAVLSNGRPHLPTWLFDWQTVRLHVLPATRAASTTVAEPVLATLRVFLDHGTELILLFELGLLVEHLRLLNRLGDLLRDVTEELNVNDR